MHISGDGSHGAGIVYDNANNKVRGHSRTELDYDTAAYYTAYVCGSLYKNGVEQVRACGGGFIVATINTQFTGTSATASLTSDHYVNMQFFDDENSSYVDYSGYSFLPGYTYPLDWLFYAPNIFTFQQSVSIRLGSTSVQSCGNPRDAIIAEYPQYGVAFTPTCADFTQTAHSAHFSFAELNSGDYTWAIIRNSLLAGLECVRTGNGNVTLIINGGYRNPAHNAAIPGSAPQSRHMFGDAADIASNTGTWQPLHNAGKNCGACVEPQDLSGSGHVHVDWRGGCPQRW
ncbi:MAG: zinc D-Ala-D-Ala carboxypeptidase [Blastocatellia bacterium]